MFVSVLETWPTSSFKLELSLKCEIGWKWKWRLADVILDGSLSSPTQASTSVRHKKESLNPGMTVPLSGKFSLPQKRF